MSILRFCLLWPFCLAMAYAQADAASVAIHVRAAAELLGVAPAMLPADPKAALAVKQIEALADGIMDAALTSVREQARPAAQQSENELLRQREKINRSLDMCEQLIREGKIHTDSLNLATIAIACAIGYLNFRRVSPGWCVDRPLLVKLAETLFSRESFARTEPPKA
jgi:glutathione S-transferase